MDLLPTFMSLAGVPPSADAQRTLDGVDISQTHLSIGARFAGEGGREGGRSEASALEASTLRNDRPLFFQAVPGGQLGVMR